MPKGVGRPAGGRKSRKPVGADTEVRILDSAIGIFAEMGYELASMRDIATAADLTPASIYLYYGDKEQLYEAACRACFDRSTAAILAFVDPSTPSMRQLHDFVRGMATTLIQDSNATRLFEREVIGASRDRLEKTGTAFRQSFGKGLELVTAVAGEGNSAASAISLFALILGLIQFSQVLAVMDGPLLTFHRDEEELARHVMDTMFAGWRDRLA